MKPFSTMSDIGQWFRCVQAPCSLVFDSYYGPQKREMTYERGVGWVCTIVTER